MSTIADLLHNEVDRLNDRKVAIDEAEEERKRVLFFNTSATERQKAYNNIYLVGVAVLVAVVIIKMIYQFDIVPDAILDILTALAISAGLIYGLILYSDIMRRNNMDFSRINLETTPNKTETQKDSDINSGNLSAVQGESDQGKCIGAACCTTDQTYNEVFSICVPNKVPIGVVPAAPTTITLKYDSADITTYPEKAPVDGQPDIVKTLIPEIVTALKDPANYKYFRISAGNYEWRPVTSFNLQKNTGNTLRRVTEDDPNWMDPASSGTRTAYDPKSMTTTPFVQAFTLMDSTDIKPFVRDIVYAKYV
jgi:hypothetical protein